MSGRQLRATAPLGPDLAAQMALAELATVRPGYRLWSEDRGTLSGTRYVAQSAKGADMHPWAVVTASLAELADATSPGEPG